MKNVRELIGIFACLVLLLFTSVVWAAPIRETGQDLYGQDNVAELVWENMTDDGLFKSAGIEVVDEAFTITGRLSVSPANMDVAQDAGTATFSVSISYDVSPYPQLSWTAAVISDGGWLSITSGASGTNAGTITCSFTANASTSVPRTATIRVTVTGSTGSPVDVTVKQAPTQCVATLDKDLLSIRYLSYLNPKWGDPSYWAFFIHEINPTYPELMLFKLTKYAIIESGSFSCEASTLDRDIGQINIPDLLVDNVDEIKHFSVTLIYEPAFSTDGNIRFRVTKYEDISN